MKLKFSKSKGLVLSVESTSGIEACYQKLKFSKNIGLLFSVLTMSGIGTC